MVSIVICVRLYIEMYNVTPRIVPTLLMVIQLNKLERYYSIQGFIAFRVALLCNFHATGQWPLKRYSDEETKAVKNTDL